ncbi:MFS transporter [Streptomyces sp. MMG1121]|uniref:MFS transporter n=1 Tax=Streptomyces sp. MMG1121 TaxID=1415544 RepID=UPI0006AF95C4|nr:MFS transporter [Streptomyces sp. MMG1121]KOV64172.1 MFS transporter [Streptomyces sp. MMG1121]
MTVFSTSSSTSSQVKGGQLAWPGLLALSCAAFTAVMTELLPAGLLPSMARPLGVAESRIGFLVTAYAAASFVAAVPVTAALRGLPRRPVLCGALLGFAVSDALVALSSSYPLTFAARLLAGAMGGTLWAMLAGYAARMVPAERRGRAIAIVLAGITLALSLGVPAGTALAGAVGWRAAFGTLAVLAVLLVVWIRLRVPGFPGEPRHARVPLGRVARRPGIRPVLSVTLFLLLGHQVMYTYVAPFAAHVGYARTGLLLAVFGTATVAGIWLTGVLIDRWPRRTLLVALGVFTGVLLVLGLAAGAHAVLVGAVALWGIAFGGAPTLIQTALVDASGPADADVATSLQTTVYNAGIAAGSLTGGVALDARGAGALPWTALVPVVLALTTVAAGRRHAFPAVRRAVAPEADQPAGPGRVAVPCTAGDHAVRRSVGHGEGQ